MATIHDIKAERDKQLAHARAIADTGTAAELRAASDAVEKAQRALIAHITDGAKPCHRCHAKPVGIEQPTGRGGFEYEVGCPVCTYVQHTDGTLRAALVRGGMKPSHAVELWNEGIDSWPLVPLNKLAAAEAVVARSAASTEHGSLAAVADVDDGAEEEPLLAHAGGDPEER